MTQIVEHLLSTYEHGRISRRDLVMSLAAAMMSSRAAAQSGPYPSPSRASITSRSAYPTWTGQWISTRSCSE
jgi:hypothetical protein